MKNKWISVNDRLPERQKIVICFIDCSMVDREQNNVEDSIGCGYIAKSIDGEKYWAVFHNPNYDYFGCLLDKKLWGEVTYWQPLPEPPKEVEDE